MQAIKYEVIPDKMFIKAVKCRDICRARVLSKEEKHKLKGGSPDILLESPLGWICTIHRDELLNKYTYADGRKISLGGWKYTNKYIVVSQDQMYVYVMYIPPKYTIEINNNGKSLIANNKKRVKGDYIICGVKEDGSIDRDIVCVVTNRMFKKMFRLLGEDIPTKIESDGKSNIENKAYNKKDSITSDIRDKQNVKEFTAIARLVRNNKLVGFVIQNRLGQTLHIDKQQLMQLCRDKQIVNMGISERDGKEYIHGIGIKIENLPQLQV